MDEIYEVAVKGFCDANTYYIEQQIKIASENLTQEQKKEMAITELLEEWKNRNR